ncbi:MAG: hemolysin [Candidatus Thermofonsia Clade 1 bacterium]|jgi:CBS domain containing-hemolysin-like protein|uniref:Hemolysin n=1 Tax=Candidatus Thermofonsia Clade 1 bacterium TaxID=2364210 RepID=A0A2M8PHU3_9CHLR|nr:MAG: hemolysin [Candidatus Thermofonsia Clade 1 bacterium]RMF49674.1 MAG: HlyC/CorC family transporter [Chloroflexota bacterium]
MSEDHSTAALISFLGLVLLSAVLSAAFSAVVNARKQHLRDMASGGQRRAARALALGEDAARLLALRQIVSVLLHFAAATAVVLGTQSLLRTSELSVWLQALTLGALLLSGALILLIFGELIPSALAAQHSEVAAMRWTPVILLLMRALSPLSALTRALSGLLTASVGAPNAYVTEEEIKTLVDAGSEEGVIEDEEKEMIYSVLQFNDKVVRELMVPRIDIVGLSAEATLEQALHVAVSEGHSRIPVYEGTIDHIIGVLYAKDLLTRLDEANRQRQVREIMRPAYFVPESKRASELLEELQRQKVHMAIVIDEYGGTAGLITIEDLLEEIVGEIQDEYDPEEEAEYQQISADEYRFDGGIHLVEVNELLNVELSTEESDTLGGYIFSVLGKVPQVGESFEHDGLRFTVESLDGRRIEWVRVLRLPADQKAEPLNAEETSLAKRSARSNPLAQT